MSKSDEIFLEKFGDIKFAEQNSISYSDYERSLNDYFRIKGIPRYSQYMTQEKTPGKYIEDFEESIEDFLSK